MKLVDIGYGNLLSAGRAIAVVSPDSLPIRRLIQDAKNISRVIDVSCGKKTKSVIITDSDHIILSSEAPQVLKERFNKE